MAMFDGVVLVNYKTTDNTEHTIKCTLCTRLLPPAFTALYKINTFEYPELIPILPTWDVVNNKWEELRLSTINSFEKVT